MWDLKYDSAVPPLPEPVGKRTRRRQGGSDGYPLDLGCWLMHVAPYFDDDTKLNDSWLLCYRGTLRVGPATDARPKADGVLASGDLYLKREVWFEGEGAHTAPPPRRPYWTPIFKRDEYRFYLRVTHLEVLPGGQLELELDTYRIDPATGTWSAFGRLSAEVSQPPLMPETWNGPFLSGDLKNERDTPIGKLTLGWVGKLLRRATVEIDHTQGRKLPLKAGNRTLQSIFAEAGWEIELDPQHDVVPAPPNGVWKDSLLHEQMLKWRKNVNFDSEWRYYVLVVEQLWQKPTLAFGKMYDAGSVDSNLVPREGLAIAGGSRFPDQPMYGSVKGGLLEDNDAAFLRATIHELGHAMGLNHNFLSREFMQATDLIAETPRGHFPQNIVWSFSPEDLVRLKHLPDPWVRPGGVPFSQGFTKLPVPLEDITSDASDEFALEVIPLTVVVPLGAPVRLHLRLTNRSSEEMLGPSSLSLADGCVSGGVTGPGGVVRSFASAKLLDGASAVRVNTGEVLEDDVILLRGPDGSLFPNPGLYGIDIDVIWIAPGGLARVRAQATILISWPPASADEPAAIAVLSNREIVIPLIFRSSPSGIGIKDQEQFDQGIAALDLALKAPGLRYYWAAIAARWSAEAGVENLDSVAALLREPVALTAVEIATFLALLQKAPAESLESFAVLQMLGVLGAAVQDLASRKLCPPSVAQQFRALLATRGETRV
jgi:hypothetical protein